MTETCSYNGCTTEAVTTLQIGDAETPTCAEHASNLAEGDNGEKGDYPVMTQPGEDEGAAWLNTDKNGKTYLSVKIGEEYHNFYPNTDLLQDALNRQHQVTQNE